MTTIVEGLQNATNTISENAAQYFAQITALQDFINTLKAKVGSFDDVGTLNHIVIAPVPAYTAMPKGTGFRIWPAFTNTGAVDVKVNDLAAVPLLRRDGSALQPLDIIAGVPFDIVMGAGNTFRLAGLAQSEVPRIVASPTLYVRPDGNDANDGSANDAAHAFATIAAAAARGVSRFFLAGVVLTIQLGMPGTYAFPGSVSGGLGSVLIQGDVANPTSYSLSGAGQGSGNACMGITGGGLQLRGLTLVNTGTTNHTLGASAGGNARLDFVQFSSINGSNYSHVIAGGGSSITLGSGVSINWGMGSALLALGGSITVNGVVTLANTPAFSSALAIAQSNGSILFATSSGAGWAGTAATGPRYLATLNGVINTFGSGANFIPGSVAGSTSTGGQYA